MTRTETHTAPASSSAPHTSADVTVEELARENEQLKDELAAMRDLAFRDQLTGLYSRRYLNEFLEQQIRDMSKARNVVLGLCDIDNFKAINDLRGHRSGDIAIVCIADIIDDLSGSAPVIRWGGEELLVVFLNVHEDEALRLCDQIRQGVETYRINDGIGTFSCTLTFGLGSYDPNLSFEENFALIDRALYRGKETGKNRCVMVQHDEQDEERV